MKKISLNSTNGHNSAYTALEASISRLLHGLGVDDGHLDNIEYHESGQLEILIDHDADIDAYSIGDIGDLDNDGDNYRLTVNPDKMGAELKRNWWTYCLADIAKNEGALILDDSDDEKKLMVDSSDGDSVKRLNTAASLLGLKLHPFETTHGHKLCLVLDDKKTEHSDCMSSLDIYTFKEEISISAPGQARKRRI